MFQIKQLSEYTQIELAKLLADNLDSVGSWNTQAREAWKELSGRNVQDRFPMLIEFTGGTQIICKDSFQLPSGEVFFKIIKKNYKPEVVRWEQK